MQTRREIRNRIYTIIKNGDTAMNRAREITSIVAESNQVVAKLSALKHYHQGLQGKTFEKIFYDFCTENKDIMPVPDIPVLDKSLIQISETQLIDSSNLIQEYHGRFGKKVKVTNWFNCSIINFHGKIIFSYRMDMNPYCVHTRTGICFMDENLNPIPNTHKVLKLVSKRISEDARLHEYNGELYVTYADGISSLGIGKINPETLEVTESYYLEKPDGRRIEKNWVFFESNGKHYTVYNTVPHQVYEVNGAAIEQVTDTTWIPEWKWGEIKGGSTPTFHNGLYYSFFHSTQSIYFPKEDITGRQYFSGCYAFEKKLPFTPRLISKEPILAGELCDRKLNRLSRHLFVVYPNGAIRTEGGWNIVFGYNDYECRKVFISDEAISENLVKT